MSYIQLSLSSKVLGRETSVNVLLPNPRVKDQDLEIYNLREKYPTLYLFHGASGNHMDWIRYSQVQTLADEYQIAVVMPSVELGFYTNMKYGEAYFSYVSEELPRYVRKILPLSEKKEDNFLAGLSMGGYGACKVAFTYPDQYRAVASLSGVMDVGMLMEQQELSGMIGLTEVLKWCYGDILGARTEENNLLMLLKKKEKNKIVLPRIFQSVGTEDFLYDINQKFHEEIVEMGIVSTYEEHSGSHDWSYWQKHIYRVFEWMFGGES